MTPFSELLAVIGPHVFFFFFFSAASGSPALSDTERTQRWGPEQSRRNRSRGCISGPLAWFLAGYLDPESPRTLLQSLSYAIPASGPAPSIALGFAQIFQSDHERPRLLGWNMGRRLAPCLSPPQIGSKMMGPKAMKNQLGRELTDPTRGTCSLPGYPEEPSSAQVSCHTHVS